MKARAAPLEALLGEAATAAARKRAGMEPGPLSSSRASLATLRAYVEDLEAVQADLRASAAAESEGELFASGQGREPGEEG
jgi:hypothetical protein